MHWLEHRYKFIQIESLCIPSTFLKLAWLVAGVALEISVSFRTTVHQGQELGEGHGQHRSVLEIFLQASEKFAHSNTPLPLGQHFSPSLHQLVHFKARERLQEGCWV